jgi:acetolactate synthase-1/2/3 large subunit
MGTGIFFPHSSRVVQIDPDAREFGRLQPIELGIVADIAPTIDVLAEAAEAASAQSSDKSAFRNLVQQHVDRRYAQISQRIADDSEKLHPMRASEVIARHVTEDIAIVTDGAVCCSWFCEVLPTTRPADLLPAGALSTMGFGFGTAVGAQAALPEGKRVMLVTGDGALGYSLAEFDTIVRHKLPVIVIVLNNESWGATLLFQQLTAGPNRITGTLLENGRYEGVAAALGAASYFADSVESLDAALKKALASDGPACINVIIDVQPIPPELLMVMGQDPFGDPPGH